MLFNKIVIVTLTNVEIEESHANLLNAGCDTKYDFISVGWSLGRDQYHICQIFLSVDRILSKRLQYDHQSEWLIIVLFINKDVCLHPIINLTNNINLNYNKIISYLF